MADIGVRHIQKRFDGFVAVHDSSFTIRGRVLRHAGAVRVRQDHVD